MEQATLEMAAISLWPYMWFIKMLRAHNEFVEDFAAGVS
jgi:hypothetical protein